MLSFPTLGDEMERQPPASGAAQLACVCEGAAYPPTPLASRRVSSPPDLTVAPLAHVGTASDMVCTARRALLDTMYLAELAFVEQLLGDWTIRTQNPWEANLFVINAYNIYYTGAMEPGREDVGVDWGLGCAVWFMPDGYVQGLACLWMETRVWSWFIW